MAHPFSEFSEKMPKIGKSSKNSGQPVVKYPPFCQKAKKTGLVAKTVANSTFNVFRPFKKEKKGEKKWSKTTFDLDLSENSVFFPKKVVFSFEKTL